MLRAPVWPLRFAFLIVDRCALVRIGVAAVLCLLQAGCGVQSDVERYQVPKQRIIDQLAVPPLEESSDRMLAAMTAHGDQYWFFKLAGSAAQLDPHAEAFREWLGSLKFSEEGPTWKLPEGWRQLPGSQFRFATIEIPTSDKPLELTVIPLPRGEEDDAQATLSNLNRWREQISLPPLTLAELDTEVKPMGVDGGLELKLVDLRGKLKGSGMAGGGPMAGLLGGGGPRPTPPVAPPTADRPTPPAAASPGLRYVTPSSWREMPASGMRAASFRLGSDEQSGEVTVIAAMGSLIDNVNRWRGQIGLDPLESDQLNRQVQAIDVGSLKGTYVEIMGPDDASPRPAILGAIVDARGQTWFVKFTGDAELAQRETANFKAFVRSLEFNGAEN